LAPSFYYSVSFKSLAWLSAAYLQQAIFLQQEQTVVAPSFLFTQEKQQNTAPRHLPHPVQQLSQQHVSGTFGTSFGGFQGKFLPARTK
jgi:hypothetical protein